MLRQLILGTFLICLSVLSTVGFFAVASHALTRFGEVASDHLRTVRVMAELFAIVIWMVFALSVAIWIWAAAFLWVGEFETLEEAVYFSMVAFTTLGFGDVIVSKDWRLLAGMVAANGFLLFSLATAFLIEFLTRIQDPQRFETD